MSGIRIFFSRLTALFRRRRLEQELDEELQFHFQQEAELHMRQGMSAEQARFTARKRFGGLDRTKEIYRDTRGIAVVEAFLQDLRYGFRGFRKNPGFTAVAVVSLALGIGVNCAVFTLANAAILRPLPVKDPERLARISASVKGRPMSPSYPAFHALEERQRSFSELAASGGLGLQHVVFNGADIQQLDEIKGAWVSANYFTMLGLEAVVGRVFTPADSPRAGEGAVAVLRYGFWESRMGADPGVIGQTVLLNNVAFTILGVAPRTFSGDQTGEMKDIFVPIFMQPRLLSVNLLNMPTATFFRTLGRLRDGVSGTQATAELTGLYQQIVAEQNAADPAAGRVYRSDPADWRGEVAVGTPGLNQAVRKLAAPLGLLMSVAGLVLLIACCNVANLLLARGASRQHEIGTRLALGASRGRLAGQLLTESLLLAALGGALGFAAAWWGTHLLLGVSAGIVPLALDLRLDVRVVGFAIALSLLTSVVFGLLPALHSSGGRVDPALRAGPRNPGGRFRQRTSRALVAAQVGLSLWLLIGAGLLLRSLDNLRAADIGVDRDHVATFQLQLEAEFQRAPDPNRYAALRAAVSYRLESLPGVRAVAFSSYGVFSSGQTTAPARVPASGVVPANDREMRLGWVSPGFFQTLGLDLALGRDLTENDSATAPLVGIISETAARHYFGDASPVGRRIYLSGLDAQNRYIPFNDDLSNARSIAIVGVARDTRDRGPRDPAAHILYLPVAQNDDFAATLYVRTDGDPEALTPALMQVLKEFAASIRVEEAQSINGQIDSQLVFERLASRLLGFFGVLALVLAAVGLYGVMAYAVARRTGEIGVRMALGAPRSRVLAMVLRETLVLVLAGIALGIPAALATTRFLENALFGLTPTDPATIVTVSVVLLAVAALAGFVPARRASRVDPLVALRHE